jgi:autotransporter-associated beta strand protein
MVFFNIKHLAAGFSAFSLLLLTVGAASDPLGIIIKPIPDKLVVLTFDDGPASMTTVVAPILKKHGFNASFYICDFDSFRTRKDWYLTWRQMKAMAADGFEIGNHTVGHGGGLNNYLALEDQMLANGLPKPTTLAWPVFAVDWKSCPGLATNGYIFGRGGHFRPYRPTVDNPFDVPCLGANTTETFVKSVRQATGGKVPVIIYHGVPDMEHTAVSLDPEVFKAQMQYLKDNHYKVIALRDLAEYIDLVKAAKLPPTARDYKSSEPEPLVPELKPCAVVQDVKAPSPVMPSKAKAPDRSKAIVLTTAKLQSEGPKPITVNEEGLLVLERVTADNPLILNGGTLQDNNGFGSTWNGPVTLNGDTLVMAYANLNINGNMSGPGGFTRLGAVGPFGPSNSGQVTLAGVNNYTGPTIVKLGTLRVLKAASLYNGDSSKWIPSRITVANTATLMLSVGGPDEMTSEQINLFIKNLTTGIDNNGLMGGATLCLNVTPAKDPVTVSIDITDSQGPGGGAWRLKKTGKGVLQLTGKNTYTGQTILEEGTLCFVSMNSFTKGQGKPSSSLGAPTDVEAGEIVMGCEGKDGECVLRYTGIGETSDRVLNLSGKKMTVILDHAGSGLWKLSAPLLLSGYGANKTLLLQGDTQGQGECAGAIANPHDRAGKATTSVIKSGSGQWTLSGINTYTGTTAVKQGTLVCTQAKSLPANTEVLIAAGASLKLIFNGQVTVSKLTLNGKVQPPGVYNETSASGFITGAGALKVNGLQ